MSLDRARIDYDLRFQASYDGIVFGCSRAELSSGTVTSVETRVTVGQRSIGIAPSLKRYPLEGYLTGPDARLREQTLRAALASSEPKTLVHPWLGQRVVLPADYSFAWQAADIEFVRFRVTFDEAVFDAAPAEPDAAQNADEAIERLALLGGEFAQEPLAVVQWQSVAPDLLLEPATVDAAYTSEATRRALQSQAAPAGDIPSSVQKTGDAIRRSETGQLDRSTWREIDRTLILVATRTNSPTLWAFRQELAAFVGPFGAGALARVGQGVGQSLQAIAVTEGIEPNVLARRNRSLAANLFARGELRR